MLRKNLDNCVSSQRGITRTKERAKEQRKHSNKHVTGMTPKRTMTARRDAMEQHRDEGTGAVKIDKKLLRTSRKTELKTRSNLERISGSSFQIRSSSREAPGYRRPTWGGGTWFEVFTTMMIRIIHLQNISVCAVWQITVNVSICRVCEANWTLWQE